MPLRSSRTSLHRIGEFGLIRSLSRRFGWTGRSVLRGIGDDAAIIRSPANHLLLLSTDLLAEGIHFDPATATFEDIGYKATAANLSDIAAMGGVPKHILVAVAVPSSCTSSEIERLYRGLMRACRLYGVELVGGDTSASRQGLFICVTVTGVIEPGQALTRDGANVGDLLYVTGTLGDSQAGLNILRTRIRAKGEAGEKLRDRHLRYLIERHLRPTPRIEEGHLLATHRLATAAIDLSDGLSGDLAHMCEQSGVGAEIESTALPLSPACRSYAAAHRLDPISLALTGGEDYELLFTVSPDNRAKLDRLARRTRCRFSCIGTICPKGFGLRVKHRNGSSRRLTIAGYQHFQTRRETFRETKWSR
ncbi:MAG TPA: thiamine-phosphate kinase [Nitrospiraceae bacterium]|nr:thiamine-phosphate kinase [Nitrospiraceae bacterium]